jgi:hypothetical protein
LLDGKYNYITFKKTSLKIPGMKKGNVALGIVAVVLAMIILAIFVINMAQRECESNRDCHSDSYCGSDYECHQFPNKVLVKESNFLPAAFTVAIGLVVSAYVFRRK